MALTDDDVMEWKLVVYKIARSYWHRMLMRPDLEDFISEGFLGLIQGLRDYDAARNPNLKTYLCQRISWQIITAIQRDEIVERRNYRKGVRAFHCCISDAKTKDGQLLSDVLADPGREIEQRLAVLDLDLLFSAMIEEERGEFREFLRRDHDHRASWDQRTFARPKRGVSKVMVAGFARMQRVIDGESVLRLHRTVV